MEGGAVRPIGGGQAVQRVVCVRDGPGHRITHRPVCRAVGRVRVEVVRAAWPGGCSDKT